MTSIGSAVVLDIFQALAKVYRPSGEEELARKYIESVVDQAQSQWQGRLSTARDAAGNLLVRVPGTGRFAQGTKPVVLQAHMDMVLAVDGLKPGEDVRTYFKNGVKTEEVQIDGQTWIRAAGGKSTLGADDAQGIAVALRYVVDAKVEHPPLELIFTTQEEQGLVGARNISLPLQGRVLLNLDTTARGTITRGCQGVAEGKVRGTVATAPVDKDTQELALTIGGLRGGHGGRDIFRNRLNAIMAAAQLINLATRFGGRLISAQSGDGIVFNKINDSAALTLSVPADKVDAATRALQAKFAELVKSTDEDPAKALLTIAASAPTSAKALTSEATAKLGAGIAAVPNGLIVSDPQYPDNVRVSSNTGALNVDATTGTMSALFAARAFTNEEAATWQQTIDAAYAKTADHVAVDHDNVAPWMLAKDHWLVKAALDLGKDKFVAAVLIPATIECGAIAAAYTGMAAISIGADVRDNHSTKERMRKDSLVESADATQSLLQVLGEQLSR